MILTQIHTDLHRFSTENRQPRTDNCLSTAKYANHANATPIINYQSSIINRKVPRRNALPFMELCRPFPLHGRAQ